MKSYSHNFQHPTQFHFYQHPSTTKWVIQPVILLSKELSIDDLSVFEKDALQAGRACFVLLLK